MTQPDPAWLDVQYNNRARIPEHSLDKRDHSFVAPAFAHAGALAIVPNYALCPAVTIATIALQMARSLAWVYRHAALYGGDPKRIVVAGHSAGAHLAAMLLSCRWQDVARDLPSRLVHSALAISGVFDLQPVRRTPFMRADLRLTPASARRLSPMRFPAPKGTLFAAVGATRARSSCARTARSGPPGASASCRCARRSGARTI